MKYSVSKAVGNFKGQLNNNLATSRLSRGLQSISKVIDLAGRQRIAANQANQIKQALSLQEQDLLRSYENTDLDAHQRAGISDRLGRLRLLKAKTNWTNVDDFTDNFNSMFEKSKDINELANELEQVKLKNEGRNAQEQIKALASLLKSEQDNTADNYQAETRAAALKEAAGINAAARRYSADQSYASNKYRVDNPYKATSPQETTKARVDSIIKQAEEDQGSNLFGGVENLLNSLFNSSDDSFDLYNRIAQ